MSDATKLPDLTALTYFQWSNATSPNPRLAAPIDDDDTTISFTAAPKDEDDAVITAPFLMGIKNDDGYVETVYCPNGADGASGLSATGCVRGIDMSGLDYTTANTSGYAASHEQDSPVFCNITAVINSLMVNAINGNVATGGTDFVIGTEGGAGSETITIYRTTTAGAKLGFLRWNDSGTEVEYSDNGSDWTAINDVSASDLAKVSSADTTAGYLNTKITVDSDSMTKAITSPAGDERLHLTAVGGLADIVDDVTTSAAEINQLDGISANVTDTNLNTLTAGSSSDASALHAHTTKTQTFYAGEAITADHALCLMPVQIEYFDIITEGDADLGDANARRKYGVQFTATETVSGITQLNFRAKKTGAPTHNLVVTIQTDSGGDPDGTPLATVTVAGGDIGAAYATEGGAFDGAATLDVTAGTTYWCVFDAGQTDAANYFHIGVNSAVDENYLVHTRKTYDSGGSSWGGTVTNASPFFWLPVAGDTFGSAMAPTDNDYPGRVYDFYGFAKADAAANATVDVYYETVPDLSNLNTGEYYYLSSTPGAISSAEEDSSNDNLTVGRAISETELKIEIGPKVLTSSATISATGTTTVTSWFYPRTITVMGVANGSETKSFSINGECVADGQTGAQLQTGHAWYLDDGAGTSHHATIANQCQVGVQFSNTKAGAAGDAYVTYKVEG